MRFTKKITLLACLMFLIGTVLAACSDSSSSSSSGDNKEMKIATASTSGAFYPIGGVMASILSENMDAYNFTAEATGGSEENARLLDTGDADIGFFGADTFYNAYNGKGTFEGKAIENISAMARIYVNHVHILTLAEKDIKTVDDLKGKTIAVGAPGSGTSNKAEELLKANDLIFGENVTAEYLGFKEGSEALVDGIVDAVIISVGIPSGSVQELGASHDIRLVEFTEENVQNVVEAYPYYSPDTIAAGTYESITEDVLTITAPNAIGVRADLDEDLVYEMTKMLFETKLEEFKGAHNVMKTLKKETLVQSPVPYHPGAIKFYKEIGIWEE